MGILLVFTVLLNFAFFNKKFCQCHYSFTSTKRAHHIVWNSLKISHMNSFKRFWIFCAFLFWFSSFLSSLRSQHWKMGQMRLSGRFLNTVLLATLLYMKIGMIRQQSKLCWAGKIAIMRRLFFEAFFEHHQDYNHTLDSKVGKSLITRPLTYQRESQSNASLANLILCDFTASWHKIQAGYY